MERHDAAVALVTFGLAVQAFAGEAIWIEGEDAVKHSFVRHGWYDRVKKDMLSNNEWLSHYTKRGPGQAEYQFTVREGGTYSLWVRCNPVQAQQDYTLGDGEWCAMPFDDVRERQNLVKSIDHRFICWIKAGKVQLPPGEHTLHVRMRGKINNSGGIDCICLANYPWAPAGVRKPGGAAGGASAAGPQPDHLAVEGQGEYLWIEGEDAAKHSFVKHGWYHGVKKHMLSSNEWLSHYSNRGPGEAEWKIELEQGGTYAWWIRCNPVRAQQDYSIDGGPWEPCDFRDARERQNLVDNLDHRFITWVRAGKFDLGPGEHTVRIRMRGHINNSGGIDCMCFANFPWAPTGVRKPALATATAEVKEDTWFPFLPDDDPFSPESITDMSKLLHKPAGKYGFLQRDGQHLVFEKRREPTKFWGMVAGMCASPELREQQARFCAKHGVSMVRQHPVQSAIGLLAKHPRTGKRGFDPEKLDTWDQWFATLKKHGIYMTWSCFYPHIITRDDGYPADLYAELDDHGGGKSTSGVVNFMSQLQDAEWEWVKALLLHKNPYTGLRYLDDPALAIVEVHNEDCLFWHAPLNTLADGKAMPKHTAALKRKWMQWVKDRYGDDANLRRAWGAGLRRGDSVSNPDMDIYAAWEMSAEGRRVGNRLFREERRRLGDFIRFLAETQRATFAQRRARLLDLGYRGLTISTAWRAGGPAAGAANIWCDDAMDVISRHNYFGGGVGGHGIGKGKVNNDTHLAQPGSHILSSGLWQVEDKPFVMTEWTQKPPNQWKAEIAPLFAFYNLGLQGWDVSYHFAGNRPRMGSGWPAMRSYVSETPHYFGQFPALAFAVHHGHVQEAPLAAARRLALDETFQGFDALSQDFTGGGYDQKELQGKLDTPQEVLAIGRVTVKIADGQEPSAKADWNRYWDRERKVVTSMTDELVWDYGKRVVLLKAPKTQAIVGFAGGGRYDLPGVSVEVKTEFASLLFTPLDDEPLAESRHILITALAQDKQTGSVYSPDGAQLFDPGTPPLLLQPVEATITLKGRSPASVKVVDMYGVPTGKSVPTEGSTFRIHGQYRTYYYEMKR